MSREFERKLAYHCAPAIFGIKSSNLINVSKKEFPNIHLDILELNNDKHARVFFKIIYEDEKSLLLLVYRKEVLLDQLKDINNYNFLREYGYPSKVSLDSYFNYLSYRIKTVESFPHEIGVFLGYDLEDIIDFKEGKKKCLHVGYWKVYSNKEIKIKKFDRFTRCKRAALFLIEKGYGLKKIMIGTKEE